MSDQNYSPEFNELDLEKKKLEVEKLKKEVIKIDSEKIKIEAESKELNKWFFKKPQWWSFFTTIAISVLTLYTLKINGAFDTMKLKSERDSAKAERDVLVLQTEKIKFEKEKEEQIGAFNEEKRKMDSLLKIKNDSLSLIGDSLIFSNESLNKTNSQLSLLNNQRTQLETIISELNNKLKGRDEVIASINSDKQLRERTLNDSLNKIRYDLVVMKSGLDMMKVSMEKSGYNARSSIQDLVFQIDLKNKKIKELEDKLIICNQ